MHVHAVVRVGWAVPVAQVDVWMDWPLREVVLVHLRRMHRTAVLRVAEAVYRVQKVLLVK